MGIPPYRRPPFPDESLLGTMPDSKLAAFGGMSKERVVNRRRRLGIRSFHFGRQWKILRAKLRARRLAAGLTPPEVAAQANLCVGHYLEMESGKTKTSLPDTVKRLAAVLRCREGDFAAAPA